MGIISLHSFQEFENTLIKILCLLIGCMTQSRIYIQLATRDPLFHLVGCLRPHYLVRFAADDKRWADNFVQLIAGIKPKDGLSLTVFQQIR